VEHKEEHKEYSSASELSEDIDDPVLD